MDLDDLDEVLTKIKYFASDLHDKKLEFCESLNEITTTTSLSVKHLDDNQRGHLRKLYDNIKPTLQKNIDNANKILQERLQTLKQKQSDVKNLEQRLEDLKSQDESKKKNVQKLKKQCENYKQKHKRLQNLRDSIQTYKILTATHFSYKKNSTMGYIKPNNPLNFEVFDFQNSQKDISKKIWTLLENVSKEDNKNRTEEQRNNKKLILS